MSFFTNDEPNPNRTHYYTQYYECDNEYCYGVEYDPKDYVEVPKTFALFDVKPDFEY